MRIEIDLAEGGGLAVLDGDEVLLRSGIVHGRDSRPTPTHLTYIEGGLRNEPVRVSPAYGSAILRMASFSEVLGTFGGAIPSNFRADVRQRLNRRKQGRDPGSNTDIGPYRSLHARK